MKRSEGERRVWGRRYRLREKLKSYEEVRKGQAGCMIRSGPECLALCYEKDGNRAGNVWREPWLVVESGELLQWAWQAAEESGKKG